MDADRWAAFVALAITVAVIPGPDMALVARNVLVRGRAAGVATSLGVTLGIVAWGLGSGVGIAALLAASATAFTLLKLAGAGYLVWLGVSTLRHPLLPRGAGDGESPAARPGPSFSSGLVSALLNPKLGVFFLALLPQFAPPGAGAAWVVAPTLVFAGIGLGWLVTWSLLIGAARATIGSPAVERRIRRLSGAVLVALGVRLAVDTA